MHSPHAMILEGFSSLLIFLAVYLFCCWILSRLGRKFQVGSFGTFCIPFYNLYLLCQCARITPLWILGFFVPILNLVPAVYLWGTLAARLGKDFWLWGILTGLFGIPALFLAFDDSMPVANPELPFP
jgi:hypothetical protein